MRCDRVPHCFRRARALQENCARESRGRGFPPTGENAALHYADRAQGRHKRPQIDLSSRDSEKELCCRRWIPYKVEKFKITTHSYSAQSSAARPPTGPCELSRR